MTPSDSLPRLIVTGSSGFIGRHLLERLKDRYRIVGLARRSQKTSGAPVHPNIEWHQVDVADRTALAAVFRRIRASRRPDDAGDIVIHLAAHYDFTGENHPEYERTNVHGLRQVLDECAELGVQRFIFSSSIAACQFPKPGTALTEKSPPDGHHIYAVTKAIGETMLAQYQDRFPSTIVRFAATFSDWCEYAPLFMFLRTWLSEAWNRRVLGGRGESAIPYLHVRDAARLLEVLVERADLLAPGEVVLGSPSETVSHQELYDAATRFYFQAPRRALHVPRALCLPGMWMKMVAGSLLGELPFERPWMVAYIDKQLRVDASYTCARLDWEPRERLLLPRRLPFLLENLRMDPLEWNRRNHAAMKEVHLRPNLKVHQLFERHETEIEDAVAAKLLESHRFLSYRRLGPDQVRWAVHVVVHQMMATVLTREHGIYFQFCRDLAQERFRLGFEVREVCEALEEFHRASMSILLADPDSDDVRKFLEDCVTMTLRFGIDEVLDTFDELGKQAKDRPSPAAAGPPGA